jgi:hypothetical protein
MNYIKKEATKSNCKKEKLQNSLMAETLEKVLCTSMHCISTVLT